MKNPNPKISASIKNLLRITIQQSRNKYLCWVKPLLLRYFILGKIQKIVHIGRSSASKSKTGNTLEQ